MRRASALASALVWLLGCGGRSAISRPEPYDAAPQRSVAESCNGLDDDGDGQVDEEFRDARGNYVSDEHCGRCGRTCDQPIANAVTVGCELLGDAPVCVARSCKPGF